MMYDFKRETINEFMKDGAKLLFLHNDEVSESPGKFDPDLRAYLDYEREDGIRIYTMRADDVLIGYSIFFISNNFHYKSKIQATQDGIYIDPDYRGIGESFISQIDEQLMSEGIDLVFHAVKVEHDWSKALINNEYKHIENIYYREL